MTTANRAIYSIDPEVLRRFNAAYKPRERSKMVEGLLRQALEENERRLVEAIERIENDVRFSAIREVSDDVDRIAGEAL